jgi:hypothetical protein
LALIQRFGAQGFRAVDISSRLVVVKITSLMSCPAGTTPQKVIPTQVGISHWF